MGTQPSGRRRKIGTRSIAAVAVSLLFFAAGGVSPASAGYDVDTWDPWQAHGSDPMGAVRYDGNCEVVACAFLTRLEVYQGGVWRNWTRTDTSRSPVNQKRNTSATGNYCPTVNGGDSGHGWEMSYRTESYLIATSQVNHTTSVEVEASGIVKVVELRGNASGEYDISAFQTRWIPPEVRPSGRVVCD